MFNESTRIEGRVIAQLWTPEGELRQEIETKNLITLVGQYNYSVGYPSLTNGTITPPAPVYGMQLGTNSAQAVAKTGTGSFIVAYISGSTQPITAGWPTTATLTGASLIKWKCVWDAGEATNSTIREVAMVTSSADAAGTESETICRAILPTTLDKWATDTLTIVWIHSFLAT